MRTVEHPTGSRQGIDRPTGRASFISRLKDYRDLVAILAFCASGATWAYSSFATKQYVDMIHCLTNQNFAQVRSTVHSRFVRDRIVDARMTLDSMASNSEQTEAERRKAFVLREQLDADTARQRFLQNQGESALRQLLENRCMNGGASA